MNAFAAGLACFGAHACYKGCHFWFLRSTPSHVKSMRAPKSYLIKAGIALAILALIFSQISGLEVARALAAADPILVLGAMIVAGMHVFMSAARLKLLTDWHGMSLSVPVIARVNLITLFYGLFLPGELAAGAVRWHRLNQVEQKGAHVFTALVFSRLVFIAVLIVSGIGFLLLDATARTHGAGIVLPLGLLLLGVMALAALAFRSGLLRSVLALGRPLPVPGRIWSGLQKVVAAAEQYRGLSPRRLCGLVAFAFVENLFGIAHLVLMAWAINLQIGIAALGWLRSIIQIVGMLPISFAGLGVREGSLIVLLEPYGIAATAAVALSFLLLARILLLAAAGGLLEARGWFAPRSQTDRLPASKSKHRRMRTDRIRRDRFVVGALGTLLQPARPRADSHSRAAAPRPD